VSRWREPAPGEREAEERSWRVVRSAFVERRPVPRRRSRWRLVAAAAGAAVVAAALSPAGQAVLGSLRDAVRGEPNATPALYALPTGRLLVDSARGVWVVERSGSKRLLAGYHDPSWSPHGRFLAAVDGGELRALEPDGDVHWSLGRPRLRFPRWSDVGNGDERIAYLSGMTLRVVGGDGRGDWAVGPAASAAPAWRPRTHDVAYVDAGGRVVVVDADSRRRLWTANTRQRPQAVEWSSDGRFLLARGAASLTAFDGGTGRRRLEPLGPGAAPVTDATVADSTGAVAFIQTTGARSVLWVYPKLRPDGTAARRVFGGAGAFDRVLWSPNGRWLLLSWPSADQWLFLRSAAVRKLEPVSGIESSFGPDARPADWCCA
jgi:hypothetical protein